MVPFGECGQRRLVQQHQQEPLRPDGARGDAVPHQLSMALVPAGRSQTD
jgi:hypothetical protein